MTQDQCQDVRGLRLCVCVCVCVIKNVQHMQVSGADSQNHICRDRKQVQPYQPGRNDQRGLEISCETREADRTWVLT